VTWWQALTPALALYEMVGVAVGEGEDTATPLVMLPMVTTLEASLIVTALRGSAFGACHELGERLAADLRARPVAVDVCPPNGIPRHGGVA
jgi:hypothetical protein